MVSDFLGVFTIHRIMDRIDDIGTDPMDDINAFD